jgi:hypothetical protein
MSEPTNPEPMVVVASRHKKRLRYTAGGCGASAPADLLLLLQDNQPLIYARCAASSVIRDELQRFPECLSLGHSDRAGLAARFARRPPKAT